MNEKHKKYSKYTVLPEQLWDTDSLSWLEKCLAALIDQLDDGKEGCYASNSWLAKKMGIPERTIERHISSLKKNGWIVVLNKDKRNRKLGGFSRAFDNGVFNPANLRNYIPQEEKTSSIIYSKQKEYIPPIVSPVGGESAEALNKKTDNSTQTSSPETSTQESFEFFWSVYPRKIGKDNAYKQFEVNLRKRHDLQHMISSARLYEAYCKERQLEPNYIKTPAAFLKNIWNDEGSIKEWETYLVNKVDVKVPFLKMPTDAVQRLRQLIAQKQLLDKDGNPMTERTGSVEEFIKSGFWGALPGSVQKAIVEFHPSTETKLNEIQEPNGWRKHLEHNYDAENEKIQKYILKGWKSIPEWLQRDIVFEMVQK